MLRTDAKRYGLRATQDPRAGYARTAMKKLLALSLLLSGCSIALQSRPHKPSMAKTDCSTSYVYAGVDLGLVAASLATVAVGIAKSDRTGDALIGAGGLSAVVFMASAGNGLDWRSRCEAGEPMSTVVMR